MPVIVLDVALRHGPRRSRAGEGRVDRDVEDWRRMRALERVTAAGVAA